MAKRIEVDEDEFVEQYLNGATMSGLARHYGIGNARAAAILDAVGVGRSYGPRGPRTSLGTRRAIMMDYHAGLLRVEEIAEKHNISVSTINKWTETEGRRIRPRHFYQHGEGASAWKGGRHRHQNGYIVVRVYDSDAASLSVTSGGLALEHRLMMVRHLGRALLPTETVHHKNGIRDDNRIENLQLRQGPHGRGAVFACSDCGSHNVKPIEI